MLLYGAMVEGVEEVDMEEGVRDYQVKYLEYLLENGKYQFKGVDGLGKGGDSKEKDARDGHTHSHVLTGKIVAIYLRYNIRNIHKMESEIQRLFKESSNFAEIMLVIRSFNLYEFGYS